MSQKAVDRAKKKFRLLHEWTIVYAPAGTDKKSRMTVFNLPKKTATIYGWGRGRPAKDFYFHEMIHLTLWELWHTHQTSKNFERDYTEREETFITDICRQVRSFKR